MGLDLSDLSKSGVSTGALSERCHDHVMVMFMEDDDSLHPEFDTDLVTLAVISGVQYD